MRPLLSICIPTYNRSQYLVNTLDSIINDEGFCDEVEIVVSDNASTDDTGVVVQAYVKKYPNIKYYRNDENIRDFNFPTALDRGTGLYVKLNNDNRVFTKGAVAYMLAAIKDNKERRSPIFFTCGSYFNSKKGTDKIECYSLSDFVEHLSYFSTGIWIFGSWKEDWDRVQDKMKYSPLQLSQVDWFYQILCNRGHCVLMTQEISITAQVGKRTGYNWLQVHVDNYYTIIRPYYEAGKMTYKAWKTDHILQLKRMRLALTSVYVHNLMPEGWEFEMSGAKEIFWKNFKEFPYFYWYILTSPIWMAKLLLGRLVKNMLKRIQG